uniref:Uncharacterized protein n=1 Tax=Arundo donax TaxID=35708 RepID=A0A0A9GT03_ARUDO
MMIYAKARYKSAYTLIVIINSVYNHFCNTFGVWFS